MSEHLEPIVVDPRFNAFNVSIPGSPWDEIIDGLWVGGSERGYPGGTFDTVVSVYDWHFDRKRWLPTEGVRHLVVPFFDDHHGNLPEEEVEWIVDQVAFWHERGSVLVRCQAGLNRSSLVAARYLIKHHNYAPAQAVNLIRLQRSEACLFNQKFCDWLSQG